MNERLTDRLLLRPWEDADLPAMARLCSDPAVMRWVGDGRGLTRREAAAQLLTVRRHWEERGFGLWAAAERGSGRVIGWAGLAVPTFLPAVLPAVEVGWRFERAWWGRGLATEAGRAGLEHGFEDLGLERIVSLIHPENAGSRRVAEKLGLEHERDVVHPRWGYPVEVHACVRAAPGNSVALA